MEGLPAQDDDGTVGVSIKQWLVSPQVRKPQVRKEWGTFSPGAPVEIRINDEEGFQHQW